MDKMLQRHINDVENFVAVDAESLKEFRKKYLGTKGVVVELFMIFKDVPVQNKRKYSREILEFKQLAEAKYHKLKDEVTTALEG